jgi:hypothetical protein
LRDQDLVSLWQAGLQLAAAVVVVVDVHSSHAEQCSFLHLRDQDLGSLWQAGLHLPVLLLPTVCRFSKAVKTR